jgi:hypothetical protein
MQPMTAAPPRPPGRRPWWEYRSFLAALIVLSVVPLLYPPIPPLVDLLGHMGRYRVQLDVATSPWLSQYYGFHWAPIGNLGVDLLVEALAPLFGLELSVKLIILAIPPLTVAGFLWVAREVHNRVPPTAFFALPLVYSHPFLFGFVNFSLSMALALLAFGLWLRLGRIGKTKLRAGLFAPISIVVFFTHTFGWGTLGLLAFSAEAVRQHDRGSGWLRSGLNAALHASSMALPLVFMLAWRSSAPSGGTEDWFNWEAKWAWIKMIFRNRWKAWEFWSMVALVAVALEAIRNPRLGFSRNLGFSALVMIVVYALLPRIIFASAYADMRLAPFMFAVLLLAIRYRSETHLKTAQVFAALGVLFYAAQLAAVTVSLAMASDDQRAKLRALDHIPMGSRVASFVGQGCANYWAMARNSHLGAMVIVRRHGFSNDQWLIEGTNLLELRYKKPGPFATDPSEIVRPATCRRHWSVVDNQLRGDWNIQDALSRFPRDAFDFLWLIEVPPYDSERVEGMVLVWSGAGSSLYRVNPGGAEQPPRTPQREAAPVR